MELLPTRFTGASRVAAHGCAFAVALAGLAASATAAAGEIYKWVDANGQTHYSERKDAAGAAKANEVKIKVTPAPPAAATPPVRPNEDVLRRPTEPPASAPRVAPPGAAAPRRDSYRDETPAAKCALARDILSGVARRASGRPTDDNDRQIAESDVRLFCK